MTGLTGDDLVQIKEIEFLKSRYCRAIDNKGWDRLPEMFVPEARFEGFGKGTITPTSDFVTHIAKLLEGAVTVHHLQHHEIRIVGPSEARGVWCMEDYNEWPSPGVLRHVPAATGFRGYGFYEERYRQVEGRWRIEFMRLTRIRFDPVIRSAGDGINPFERRGLISPSFDWLDEPAASA